MAATEMKIPKGWVKLRGNAILREGDKFYHLGRWRLTSNPGLNAGWSSLLLGPLTYIRRLSPTPKQAKGKKK